MAGIIPAYAGSTALSSPTLIVVRGSSPRTRGARRSNVYKVAIGGDHPRVRGEHPVNPQPSISTSRIIPAYAGSTIFRSRPLSTSAGSSPRTRGALGYLQGLAEGPGDHPRVRGEHRRGQPARDRHHGIIPAYAGSTSVVSPSSSTAKGSSPRTRGAREGYFINVDVERDHPRVRGEHAHRRGRQRNHDRIIPAYAGSTVCSTLAVGDVPGSSPRTRGAPVKSSSRTLVPLDHPRVRGEHRLANGYNSHFRGSSPRTRGALITTTWM